MSPAASAAADILVVGGGFTGCALAAALAKDGRRVLLLEGRVGRNPRFNGELIHPPGVDGLAALGLLPALATHAERGVSIEGFAVVADAGSDALCLPYREIDGSRPDGWAMDHHAMVEALRGDVERRPGVTLRTGARVVDLVREGGRVIGVKLVDGEELRAPLVLSAEGRFSRLRPLVGIAPESTLLSFSLAVLVEGDVLPHPGYGHIFLGAWGPILAYPIADDLRGRTSRVRMVIDLPPDIDAKAAVARVQGDYAAFVPEPLRGALLTALAGGLSDTVQLCATHAISTRQCTTPGFALVGDAAGCSHPLTATGMTVCLSDARILGEEIDRVGALRDESIDVALHNFSLRRYRYARAREILADALYEVFRGAEDGTRAIRHGIFRYWAASRRARSASMGLLSGQDSRLGSFIAEYLRVVGQSTGGVLRGQVNDPSFAGRARSMSGLVGKSLEKLKKVARSVRDGSFR